MGTIFDYSVRVSCKKEHINELIDVFAKASCRHGGFAFEETKDGFVGCGFCKTSFLYRFAPTKLYQLCNEYEVVFEMFGYNDEKGYCEYMYSFCGYIDLFERGWCYDLYDDILEDDEMQERLEFLNKDVLKIKNKKKYLTLEEIRNLDNCIGPYLCEFYINVLEGYNRYKFNVVSK